MRHPERKSVWIQDPEDDRGIIKSHRRWHFPHQGALVGEYGKVPQKQLPSGRLTFGLLPRRGEGPNNTEQTDAGRGRA